MSTTVYLSGKISGNPRYKEQFAEAEEFLKDKYTVINVAKVVEALPSLELIKYVQLDFELIKLCDVIFMIDGWQKSKHAAAELTYAKSIGKKVLYQDYFKKYRKEKINGDND